MKNVSNKILYLLFSTTDLRVQSNRFWLASRNGSHSAVQDTDVFTRCLQAEAVEIRLELTVHICSSKLYRCISIKNIVKMYIDNVNRKIGDEYKYWCYFHFFSFIILIQWYEYIIEKCVQVWKGPVISIIWKLDKNCRVKKTWEFDSCDIHWWNNLSQNISSTCRGDNVDIKYTTTTTTERITKT